MPDDVSEDLDVVPDLRKTNPREASARQRDLLVRLEGLRAQRGVTQGRGARSAKSTAQGGQCGRYGALACAVQVKGATDSRLCRKLAVQLHVLQLYRLIPRL